MSRPQLCAICDRPRRGHGSRPHRFAKSLPPSIRLHRLLWALVDEAAPSHLQNCASPGGDPICSASCKRCKLVRLLESVERSRRKR